MQEMIVIMVKLIEGVMVEGLKKKHWGLMESILVNRSREERKRKRKGNKWVRDNI